jgi:hypothetical protein
MFLTPALFIVKCNVEEEWKGILQLRVPYWWLFQRFVIKLCSLTDTYCWLSMHARGEWWVVRAHEQAHICIYIISVSHHCHIVQQEGCHYSHFRSGILLLLLSAPLWKRQQTDWQTDTYISDLWSLPTSTLITEGEVSSSWFLFQL